MEHERESTVDDEIEFIKETGLLGMDNVLGQNYEDLEEKREASEREQKKEQLLERNLTQIDRSSAEEMNTPPITPKNIKHEADQEPLQPEKEKKEQEEEEKEETEQKEEITLEKVIKLERPREEHPKIEEFKESTLDKTRRAKGDKITVKSEELERSDELARTMSEKAILEEKGVLFKDKLLKDEEKEQDSGVIDRNKPNIYYVMDMMKQIKRPRAKRGDEPFEQGEEMDEKAGLMSNRAILEAKGVLFKMVELNEDEKESNEEIIEKNEPNISYPLSLVKGMKPLSLAEQIKQRVVKEHEQKHVKFREAPTFAELVKEKLVSESEKETDWSKIEDQMPNIEDRMRKMREWETQYFSEPKKEFESESMYNPKEPADPPAEEAEEDVKNLVVQNMPNLSVMMSKINEIETIKELEDKLEHHKNFTIEFVKEIKDYLGEFFNFIFDRVRFILV